jgi:ATP-binding cassette subfamily C protein
MIGRIEKAAAKVTNAWKHSACRTFTVTLFDIASWRVALALAFAICVTVTQGVQLLMLVPLMELIGLKVQQGTVGWLAELVSSVFAAVNVHPTPTTVLSAFVFIISLQALIARWQTVFNLKLQQDVVTALRRRLYDAIVSADWLTLARSRSSDFVHALTMELDRVSSATYFLLTTVANVMVLSVYVVFALQLSLVMTALVFFCGVGLLLILRKKRRAARRAGEEISIATNNLYAASIQHVDGMKATKSYGMEERSTRLYSGLAEEVAQMYLKATRNYAQAGFWFRVGSILILSFILYIALEVLVLPTAGLLLLLFLFARIIPQFSSIQQGYQQYLENVPAFTKSMEMLARYESAAESRVESPEEVELRRDIQLVGVSFTYGGEVPAIRDLDLTIQAGKTTAIVGRSGAGKSTIADLVMGLLVPDHGQVLVDGVPLSSERIRSWRRQIGYVSQDTFLFNDTVRANLLLARPEAGDEDIDRALESAAAKEFVCKLPNGMETVLGDRGVRLSGGERQRLALARALLRRPSLLILDEATSALDSENEKRIQSAIEQLHGRMTILIIAHRLSTIQGADTIHVLEQGYLVESGSWSELVNRESGQFYALCKAQRLLS